jgi:hypothetical protein
MAYVANWFTLVTSIAFVVMVGLQENGYINVLDRLFIRDGFCISYQDQSVYLQSHMLCFYGDTAFAALMFVICRANKGNMSYEAIKPVNDSILNVFAHGCGHVFMAFYSFTSESRDKTPY